MKSKPLPIIFGINSTSLSAAEIDLFIKEEVSGFILFSRNVKSKEQLLELTLSLKNIYPNKSTPIFIDQEGGRVARIKPPISETLYPPAGYFGEKYKEDKELAKAWTESNYLKLMTELKDIMPSASVKSANFRLKQISAGKSVIGG